MKTKLLFRSLELISRVLCFLIIINLLISYSKLTAFTAFIGYDFASSIFYIFLLMVIIVIARKGRGNGFILVKIEKYLHYLKWIFLLEAIFLLGLKIFIVNQVIGNQKLKPVDLSAITTPNLGFLIITLLSFFISAVLKERNLLKEHQDLTI